mmetsp:Transcript_397/g.781  ORF Transcript_397/g.781 Transcript_397/m.781 type:complete len:150 (-) Transcript_397:259-708(-)|eukprot:CAMPEP_0183703554 /NCGR_PEP_ID=MMETSP0737-20130205/1262_1 /TAXON_ID=385413 /ORGANISM="Thalassiosira miniscula, Strain CCMP1093" /LENGTH=149 /DNA_ID=CAMNT_0025930327 /DNA_START=75 /DNA_END=524 /DNA_ORIENTATION=-
MTNLLRIAAAVALLLADPTNTVVVVSAQPQKAHQRRIPHRPDRPSIREMVEQKYARQEEHLTNMIAQKQGMIEDHVSGRKLLGGGDEELARHQRHLKGLHRKLVGAKNKDPQMLKIEIEEEIKLQERMMKGEFIWTPGSDELVLREDNE